MRNAMIMMGQQQLAIGGVAGKSAMEGTAQQGNPFFQVIEQMLVQMNQDGQEIGSLGQFGELEQLNQLAEFGQLGELGQLDELSELEQGDEALQEKMELLAAMMYNMSATPQNVNEADMALLRGQADVSTHPDQSAIPETAIQTTTTKEMAAAEMATVLSSNEGKTVNGSRPQGATAQIDTQFATMLATDEPIKSTVTVTSNRSDLSDGQRQEQDGQQTFMASVNKAKNAMRTENEEPQTVETTINTEKKVESSFQLEAKKAEAANQPPKLMDQVEQGIRGNLKMDKNEFTIKLNPETLGEITVKLVHEDGKATLHIVTANGNTAQLINDELAALREAVRPMHIEVRQAIPTVEESGEMQQFDMSGQQFNMSGQQFTKNNQNFTPHKNMEHEEFLFDEAGDLIEQPTTSNPNNLSIYI